MIGMDHSVHECFEARPRNEGIAKGEPDKLLEDGWFFSNFLDRKTGMSRNFSDPSSSSNYKEKLLGRSYEETYESIKKLSLRDESLRSNLIRAPSMPPSMERKDSNLTIKGSDPEARRKLITGKTSSKNLVRAPSLPTGSEAEEFQDEETEFSMGKLIRQASLNNPNTAPPRTRAAKGLTPSSSISRQKSRTKAETDSLKPEEIRPQRVTNQLKTQKSLSALDLEELQGKELGFDFDNRESKAGATSTIPGLQEKKRMAKDEEKNTRPTTLYRAQSWAPPVPKWGGKRSTEEDMKAQIKFWARAVASNVRQEC